MDHFGQRYIDAQAFCGEITRLRVYRAFVNEGILEELERTRAVVPKLRMRYPDSIARQWWGETHPECGRLFGELEPNGPRLVAAAALEDALYRRRHQHVYGRREHPLDDIAPDFAAFVHRPAECLFAPWGSFRLDVSNETHPTLYDSQAVRTLYSSWQTLLVAEVADMGVHYFLNLTDPDVSRQAHKSVFEGGILPTHAALLYTAPIAVARAFARHERVLDALVWFIEEDANALLFATLHGPPGRRRLTREEACQYQADRATAAQEAASRHDVGLDEILGLAEFLGERWGDWSGAGRPLIAGEYPRYLGNAVLMAQIVGELPYGEVRRHIGRQGGYFEPILDVAWPDWAEVEKDRARRTLKAMVRDPIGPRLEASDADIDAFIEFLDREGLHSFFWRLRSCEQHALRGSTFAVTGLHSDVQGMAIVVEHVMRALGATGKDLYELFKQLWGAELEVAALLRRDDISRLARQGSLAGDWPAYLKQIEKLRRGGQAERVGADLVLAHRLRGAVHGELLERDTGALEDLFTTLLRAAVLTFAHRRPPGVLSATRDEPS